MSAPNTVVGIAVLDPSVRGRPGDEFQYLALFYIDNKGQRGRTVVPVYPNGKPHPTSFRDAWSFKKVGDVLHMTPSLRIGRTVEKQFIEEFHNTLEWTVPYRDLPGGVDRDIFANEINPELSDT